MVKITKTKPIIIKTRDLRVLLNIDDILVFFSYSRNVFQIKKEFCIRKKSSECLDLKFMEFILIRDSTILIFFRL